jgi:hypothetical protein
MSEVRATGWLDAVRRTNMAPLERLVADPKFERFVITVIIINAIALGLETSPTIMTSFGGFLH